VTRAARPRKLRPCRALICRISISYLRKLQNLLLQRLSTRAQPRPSLLSYSMNGDYLPLFKVNVPCVARKQRIKRGIAPRRVLMSRDPSKMGS
jgi:hypothetical protein